MLQLVLLSSTAYAESREAEEVQAKISGYARLHEAACAIKAQAVVAARTLEQFTERERTSPGVASLNNDARNLMRFAQECVRIQVSLRDVLNSIRLPEPNDCAGVRQNSVVYMEATTRASANVEHGPCAAILAELRQNVERIRAREDTPEEIAADPGKTTAKLMEVACHVDAMIQLSLEDQTEQREIERTSGVVDLSARRELGEDLARLRGQKKACAAALKARRQRAKSCPKFEGTGMRDLSYGDTCAELAALTT